LSDVGVAVTTSTSLTNARMGKQDESALARAGRGQLEPHPPVPPRNWLNPFTATMGNNVLTAPNRLLVLLAQIPAPQV
jgi:hypothetical protein